MKRSWWGRWQGFAAGLMLVLALMACSSEVLVPGYDEELGPSAPPPHAGAPGRPGQRGPVDWRGEVIYFVMTDRFSSGDSSNDDGARRVGAGDEKDLSNPLGWHGGDFKGITQKIREGYFQKMGFTAIWLTPVYFQVPAISVADGPNQGRLFAGYHGYWAEDFLTFDPHYGTLGEYKNLIRTARQHGLKIIQDMVVNHTGYGSRLSREKPEWFHTAEDCERAPQNEKVHACDLAGLPDFDDRIPEVRDFLNSTVRHWVNLGIDGIRMDTVKHVYDSYWQQFFAPGGPGDPKVVWTVGEIFDGNPSNIARYMDSLGLPSAFDFPLYFRLKDHLSSPGGNLDDVAVVFSWDGAYSDPSRLTTFVDNHDVPRFMSEAMNRGVSQPNATERLDMALSLIYTVRGTPSVYYGSEIAMTGKGDPYSYPLGEGNRERMDFSRVPSSPLPARLASLAQARKSYRALTHGRQQELWRPNGGPEHQKQIFAFRRTLTGHNPVVAVLNNSDAPINLSSLHGGGIPLLGTFRDGATLTEVTGRAHGLSVDGMGRLVGSVPPRTLLAVSAEAGAGEGVNENLTNVTNLAALAGDGAVRLSWTPVADEAVSGYRVYTRTGGESRQVNFSPIPASEAAYTVSGLSNELEHEFKVVSVDAGGRESAGAPTVTATPSVNNTATVTFTVDARSQGAGALELRRFDTGSQIEYAMAPVAGQKGFWTVQLELPLLREIAFKFGNRASGAKNSGYEGDGQSDRRLLLEQRTVSYSGVYDFITVPVPDAAIEGRVTSGGAGLRGARVDSSTDARYYYAFTFEDGTYYLPHPRSATSVTASAPGHGAPASQTVTAPAQGVDFALTATTKYAIDGNLADWTPKATLLSPDAGLWGDGNNFKELKVDWDESHLYLGYSYSAWDNSAIVYLDSGTGGSTTAKEFNAWKRRADFVTPVNFFLAQFEGNAAELRRVESSTQAALVNMSYESVTVSSSSGFTTEVAIPWTTLGYSGRPTTTLNFYAGIFGDNWGAGDIAPNSTSMPAGNNSIDGQDQSNAIFREAFSVTVGN